MKTSLSECELIKLHLAHALVVYCSLLIRSVNMPANRFHAGCKAIFLSSPALYEEKA